jgi:hypothetical protein
MEGPGPDEVLSPKRRAIYNFIADAGLKGVSRKEAFAKLFPGSKAEASLRTAIHGINKDIEPNKIVSNHGMIRLMGTDH